MVSNLVDLPQNRAFAEEVWFLGVDDDVVKIACPVASTAALHTNYQTNFRKSHTLGGSRASHMLRDATQVVTFLSISDKKCPDGPKR